MFVLSIIGLLALIVLITCLCETDNGGWGIVSIIAVALVCEFWLFKGTALVVWSYIATNPGVIIAGFLGYIILGVIWSVLKWKWFVVDYVNENREEILKYKTNGWDDKTIRYHIKPSENKARLTTWMGYWPFSFGWFIIHKPFTRLYNWLYKKLSTIYQQISNSAYNKITN